MHPWVTVRQQLSHSFWDAMDEAYWEQHAFGPIERLFYSFEADWNCTWLAGGEL